MRCVLGNHGLKWNWSILILVQNHQVLIISNRISHSWSPELIIGSKKSLVELEVPKNELLHFFTFFALLKSFFFTLSYGFLKRITYYNILNTAIFRAPLAPLWEEIHTSAYWVFCWKLNSQQLLHETFFLYKLYFY